MKRWCAWVLLLMLTAGLLMSGCGTGRPDETIPTPASESAESASQVIPPDIPTEKPEKPEPEKTDPPEEVLPDPENCVSAQWAEDAFPDLSDYERFRLGLDEELPLIYFSTEQTVEQFKVLSLTFVDIDNDGTARFTVEETWNHGTMTPEEPLLVRIQLIGTIPNNGISYVDANGKTRYFAVNVSGYDDSLLLTEFTPVHEIQSS